MLLLAIEDGDRSKVVIMTPLLVLERIAKRYRAGDSFVGALSQVSLRIDRGEFIAVMGRSGSDG